MYVIVILKCIVDCESIEAFKTLVKLLANPKKKKENLSEILLSVKVSVSPLQDVTCLYMYMYVQLLASFIFVFIE